MHINDLTKLGVIRKAYSSHKSLAFIIKKHSEQVRVKVEW